MSKMLTGSIDLKKIDKTKIVSTDKYGNEFANGAKYLNIIVWVNDEEDQYGNTANIQISQSKEEREAKEKPTYIGNLKEFKSKKQEPNTDNPNENSEDDLPF